MAQQKTKGIFSTPPPQGTQDILRNLLSGQGVDWDVDQPYSRPDLPGAYQMQDPYMGRPMSALLGQISPLLGMVGNMLQVDRTLSRNLFPNAMSYRGSFTQPGNMANNLLNQEMNRQYGGATAYNAWDLSASPNYANTRETNLNWKMRNELLTGTYRRLGYEGEAAKDAAKAAMSNIANPMNIAALAAVGMQNFAGMDVALKKGMFQSGLMTHMDMQRMMPGMDNMLTAAQQKLFYEGVGGEKAYGAQQEADRGRAVMNNKRLMMDFMRHPSQYGGFSAEGVGQLAAEMSRTGQLDMGMTGKGYSRKVRDMAKALDPLREIFGEDIPNLMSKLDKMLGTNAMATFSKEQILGKSLQLKHTAAMTGTSMEVMGNMIATSQSYFQQVGLDKRGGFQAAMDAATLLTGQKTTARLDEEMYRDKTLKVVSAQQERRETRYASGAYVLWAEQQRRSRAGWDKMTDEQRMAEFQVKMGGIKGPVTLENLASTFGLGAGQIAAASLTRAAEDARKTTALSTGLLGERSKLYETRKNNYVLELVQATMGKNAGATAFAASLKGMGVKQLEEALRAKDITLNPQQLDLLARATIGQGYNAEMAEQLSKDMKQMPLRNAEIAKRSELDRRLNKLGVGKSFGLAGLMEYVMDKRTAGNVGDLIASMAGVANNKADAARIAGALKDESKSNAAAKARRTIFMSQMSPAEGPVNESAVNHRLSEFNKMVSAAVSGTTEGGQALDLADPRVQQLRKNLIKAYADPTTSPDRIRFLEAESARYGLTNQQVKASKLKGYGKDIVRQYEDMRANEHTTVADETKFFTKLALKDASEESGLSPEVLKDIQGKYEAESKGGQKTVDMAKIVGGLEGVSTEQQQKFMSKFEESGQKLGVATKPDMMQMIFDALKDMLTNVQSIAGKLGSGG